MDNINSTSYSDGFRMPADYEKHSGCWMLFPERMDNWRDNAVPAKKKFAHVAEVISKFENVTVGVSIEQLSNARKLLPKQIRIIDVEYDDVWVRDTGSTFVVNSLGDVRGVDWEFNSWGGLYASWDKDNKVANIIWEMVVFNWQRRI